MLVIHADKDCEEIDGLVSCVCNSELDFGYLNIFIGEVNYTISPEDYLMVDTNNLCTF